MSNSMKVRRIKNQAESTAEVGRTAAKASKVTLNDQQPLSLLLRLKGAYFLS